MQKTTFRSVQENTRFWQVFIGLLVLVGAGLAAFVFMEHEGHWVTGMNQMVVWGTPHVFAVFLIVAASGALNVASIGSVFGRTVYKPMGRLSAWLAITLLAGGLAVLVMDLGRPDRLFVAMTSYNFRSIFAWNIFLYTGFFAIVGVYLWFMMDRAMKPYSSNVGLVAFVFRLILTTGTGSIFGFLASRALYNSALLPPMFIVMSFAFGLAIYLLVLLWAMQAEGRPVGDALVGRLGRLLGVFMAGVLLFVVAFHLTNIYRPGTRDVSHFILLGGGIYTAVFWVGQILIGTLAPIALTLAPGMRNHRSNVVLASVLVIVGGLSQLYVLIVGGQAFPQQLFPGYLADSSFYDGQVASYAPSIPEVLLGLGMGGGVFLLLAIGGLRVLPLLPTTLADEAIDPHHTPAVAPAPAESDAQAA